MLAGAEGFEPPSPVLETGSLTVELTPLNYICGLKDFRIVGSKGFRIRQFTNPTIRKLLHFFVRRMLAAPAAKLLQFQPVRRRLAVLGGRIVPLFAITALHRNDLSGHENQLLASSS
jgi:hypothetical protein